MEFHLAGFIESHLDTRVKIVRTVDPLHWAEGNPIVAGCQNAELCNTTTIATMKNIRMVLDK